MKSPTSPDRNQTRGLPDHVKVVGMYRLVEDARDHAGRERGLARRRWAFRAADTGGVQGVAVVDAGQAFRAAGPRRPPSWWWRWSRRVGGLIVAEGRLGSAVGVPSG